MIRSKQLRQALQLELDTHAMRGPVVKQDVVERAVRLIPERFWALADLEASKAYYLMRELGFLMREPVASMLIDRHLKGIPPKWHSLFRRIPSFICISTGHRAEHVRTLGATPDQFELNYQIKNDLVRDVVASRDWSRNVRRVLIQAGARCIEEI